MQSGEDGYLEGIDCAALVSDLTHSVIHFLGQFQDVLRFGRFAQAQWISLVVNLDFDDVASFFLRQFASR